MQNKQQSQNNKQENSKPKNNKELKKLLKEVEADCELIQNKDDVEAVFDKLIKYPYKIKFSYRISGSIFLLSLLATIGLFYFGTENSMNLSIISAIISIVAFSYLGYKDYSLRSLKKTLVNKTMQILYKSENLSEDFLDYNLHRFTDFRRGNYSRELQSGVEVEFNSRYSILGKLRIPIVTLHYVDEYEMRDKEGRTTKHYRHYYRQGGIFPSHSNTKSILISQDKFFSNYEHSFKPASRKFQKLFRSVIGDSELALAKFLEPDVVLMLQNATKKLSGLTLEFTQDGYFLLAKSGSNLFETATIHSLEFPKELKEELFTQTSYKNLDYLLALADSLIRQMQ